MRHNLIIKDGMLVRLHRETSEDGLGLLLKGIAMAIEAPGTVVKLETGGNELEIVCRKP